MMAQTMIDRGAVQNTLPEPENQRLEDEKSFWDNPFSGGYMLVLGRVSVLKLFFQVIPGSPQQKKP